MSNRTRLCHVALWCSDLERSRRFYEEVIGLRFIGTRTDGSCLDMTDGTNNITLLHYENGQRPRMEEGHEFIHLGVVVSDLTATWQKLREWGAEFPNKSVKLRLSQDSERPPDCAFKVFDPDGNVIDITGDKQEWLGVNLASGSTTSGRGPATS